MNTHSWQDVVLAAIAILPGITAAIVAAVSSVRNGHKLNRLSDGERRRGSRRNEKRRNLDDGNTASNPDWYKAPDV
jgi:hypothetical protein